MDARDKSGRDDLKLKALISEMDNEQIGILKAFAEGLLASKRLRERNGKVLKDDT